MTYHRVTIKEEPTSPPSVVQNLANCQLVEMSPNSSLQITQNLEQEQYSSELSGSNAAQWSVNSQTAAQEGGNSLQSEAKARLRGSVLGRRSDLSQTPLFEEPKQYKLTPHEEEKRLKRKRQNREAAKRCREKKRARQVETSEISEKMNKENRNLEQEIVELRGQVKSLKDTLLQHVRSGQCKMPHSVNHVLLCADTGADNAWIQPITIGMEVSSYPLQQQQDMASLPTQSWPSVTTAADHEVPQSCLGSTATLQTTGGSNNLPSWDLTNLESDLPSGLSDQLKPYLTPEPVSRGSHVPDQSTSFMSPPSVPYGKSSNDIFTTPSCVRNLTPLFTDPTALTERESAAPELATVTPLSCESSSQHSRPCLPSITVSHSSHTDLVHLPFIAPPDSFQQQAERSQSPDLLQCVSPNDIQQISPVSPHVYMDSRPATPNTNSCQINSNYHSLSPIATGEHNNNSNNYYYSHTPTKLQINNNITSSQYKSSHTTLPSFQSITPPSGNASREECIFNFDLPAIQGLERAPEHEASSPFLLTSGRDATYSPL